MCIRDRIDTDAGSIPVVKSVFAENVAGVTPSVNVFINTETLFVVSFPVAISGLPSPFKSQIETELGAVPVV